MGKTPITESLGQLPKLRQLIKLHEQRAQMNDEYIETQRELIQMCRERIELHEKYEVELERLVETQEKLLIIYKQI